ncbi:MAG: hypothetical protein ACRD4P_11695, partial [Bryobacteraceae bacterium]
SVTSGGRRESAMTDEELTEYLRDNGYPGHIVRGGRAGLIERWKRFVGEVERGYRYGLEDYRNDLDIRGIIALVGIAEEVSEDDRRLEAMLTNRETRVWESTSENPFWDFGYPRNARHALLEDLKAEGLAE